MLLQRYFLIWKMVFTPYIIFSFSIFIYSIKIWQRIKYIYHNGFLEYAYTITTKFEYVAYVKTNAFSFMLSTRNVLLSRFEKLESAISICNYIIAIKDSSVNITHCILKLQVVYTISMLLLLLIIYFIRMFYSYIIDKCVAVRLLHIIAYLH